MQLFEVHDRPLRRLTANEFFRLVELGVLGEDEHVELLDGLMVGMAPQGKHHVLAAARLTRALVNAAPESFEVLVESSLTLSAGFVPEPDLALVKAKDLELPSTRPRRPLLIVEIADSTLRADRAKATSYARVGVPELWIINIPERTVEVHTAPTRRGLPHFRSVTVLSTSDVLRTATLPRLKLSVASLFASRH